MSDLSERNEHQPTDAGVAVVGMAGRFPGANDVSQFWENVKNGVDSITRFPPEELEINVLSEDDESSGDYVCAKGMLDDIDLFDARFFGYLPREAEVMDPQHRIFLEICWEALENAGCDPQRYPGAIGVFGGCYMDTYILWNLCADENFRKRLVESIQVGSLQTELGNDKDYLATRVAYKLGLRGPAMTLQTACSTSLVAIATACQSIESYQCDMALAGGVTLVLPQKKGYFYKEGGMLSPDGHCRPFDADAAGTVFSHGAAIVVLKRLENAIADGDTIYSVIRGYATNNDGGEKVSYTAPSVDGQAEVISLALGMGGINAESIGLVEAHGTATPLGDPIEISGLTTAYRTMTDAKQYCSIGSVKANLGHLDVASGAIGLIKTSLALKEKVLPPSINFEKPNPKIDFENSPFFVNTELRAWEQSDFPRRAGVSSFGVGGTNAHVVLEEAPQQTFENGGRDGELLTLSARSGEALAMQASQLADFLESNSEVDLANVAHTLRFGRKIFEYREAVFVSDREDAIVKLRKTAGGLSDSSAIASNPALVFLFPGQGAQYPGMARALYDKHICFRDAIDEVAEAILEDRDFGFDIRPYIFWSPDNADRTEEQVSAELAETRIAQPAIFAVEVALAKLLASWNITPACVIGHSVGEFAAAVCAGVYSAPDAARLVAARGRLMQDQPVGQMLAVLAPHDEISEFELEGVDLAAVNAPDVCVVSGPHSAIARLSERLADKKIGAKILQTSHAFHSRMMAPAREPLEAAAAQVERSSPSIPVISTLSGAKTSHAEFATPKYWGDQLMSPVLFADAVKCAAAEFNVFVEIGPGRSLSAMARQCFAVDSRCLATSSMGDPKNAEIYTLLGDLWRQGVSVDWHAVDLRRMQKIPLPTYPFERKRFWVEPESASSSVSAANLASTKTSRSDKSAVEELVEQQLSVISEQLKMLKGAG